MTLFEVSYAVLWILVLVLGAAVFALYHHFAELYLASREGRASQGPEVGSSINRLRLAGGRDYELQLGQPTLLLFTSTTCKICEKLRVDIGQFAARRPDIAIDVLCAGSGREVSDWARALPSRVRVFGDRGYKVAATLGIGMTPFVVGVDAAGQVRVKGLVNEEFGLQWAADETSSRAPTMPVPVQVAR